MHRSGESGTAWLGFRVVARSVRIVAVVLAVGAACGGSGGPRDGLEADTARFTYDSRTVEVPLTACGQDGDTVLMAGTQGAVVLQVEADVGDGGTARTGVTVDMGGGEIWGAFGTDMRRAAAGTISEVRAEGDRLIVEGTWAFLDGDLQPTPAGPTAEGRLVARCPEPDQNAA